MAERFKAAVLKTVERKLRGFESLPLRQSVGGICSEGQQRGFEVEAVVLDVVAPAVDAAQAAAPVG